ncbi:MAG: hypothetical protein R3E31_01700 [Chloroflexota bacterium]|nr:hypothetical protein [Anaerolineales bacterium]MCA9975882.1 hypothetical protein [Anaerolineales bacterium]
MGDQKAHDYRAYLLRLWRESESAPWRASLENPHTGERVRFANDEQLFTYLQEQMTSSFTQDSYDA